MKLIIKTPKVNQNIFKQVIFKQRMDKPIKSSERLNEGKISEKLKGNPWMIATIILGVVSVILLAVSFKAGITGYVISEQEAGKNLVNYFKGKVSYVSSEDIGNMYKVVVEYQGEEYPFYVTKDGKYYTIQLAPMKPSALSSEESTQQNQKTEIPKTEKPVVEAFVFSYCHYGLQFEKALLPVYKILKNKADIRIVAIGAMHGKYEETESIRQICIEKEYGRDKLWDYLEKFLGKTEIGNCRGEENCSNPIVEQIMAEVSIDKTRINNCIANEGQSLYEKDMLRAQELGISGSPTFVINNVPIQVSRSPNAIKEAVCSAFIQAPSECSQALSSESAAPWFGYSPSSSSSSAQC